MTEILLILTGIFNACMDTLNHKHKGSIFEHWGWGSKSDTWKQKYKQNDPKLGEKFPFSKTLLVFLTDGWHFFQMLWRVSFTLAIVFYSDWFINLLNIQNTGWLVLFVWYSVLYLISFNLFYSKLLRYGKTNV